MESAETDHLISMMPSLDPANDKTEDDSAPQCRICLSCEDSDDLIMPCLCSGSAAWIHRTCLDDWRAINVGRKAFSECSTCFFRYTIEPSRTAEEAEKSRSRKLRLRVIRDVMMGVVCVVAAMCLIAVLIGRLDEAAGSPLRRIWPSSINHLYVYWLCAFLVALACVGLFGLIAQCLGLQDRILGRAPENERFGMERFFLDPYCCHFHGGGHHDGGGDAGEAMMIICIVIVIVLAIFGIVYGAIYGTWLIEKLSSRSIKRRWYRSECDSQPVKDWSADREGLRQLARKAK